MRTRTVRQVKRGFTLIEILIVVVILGILAAIVIPQFTDASEEANESAAKSTLQTVRGQVELCRVKSPDVCECTIGDAAALATLLGNMVDEGYLQAEPQMPGDFTLDVDDTGSACDRVVALDGDDNEMDW